MEAKERFEFIESKMYQFGMLALLETLEVLEQVEEFEWCEAIINVINKHNGRGGEVFPTRKSKEAIEIYRKSMIKNWSLDKGVAIRNAEHHAGEILNEIEKHETKR